MEQGGELETAANEIPVNMSVIRGTIGPGESAAWAGKSLDSWKVTLFFVINMRWIAQPSYNSLVFKFPVATFSGRELELWLLSSTNSVAPQFDDGWWVALCAATLPQAVLQPLG